MAARFPGLIIPRPEHEQRIFYLVLREPETFLRRTSLVAADVGLQPPKLAETALCKELCYPDAEEALLHQAADYMLAKHMRA